MKNQSNTRRSSDSEFHQLNYLLISIIVLGIGYTYYESFYSQFLTSYYLESFFLFIGIISSFGLYFDVLRQNNLKNYSYLIGLLGIAFIVISTFDHFIFCYLLFVLFLWCAGCIHFIFAILRDSKNRITLINTFCMYISFPLFILISEHFLILSGQSNSLVKDEFLMAMDGTLGFYPSLVIGRFLRSLPQDINNVITLGYFLLPLAFIFIYIKTKNLEKKGPFDFFVEVLLIGILGFMLYNIIPGCGSHYAFNKTWPDSLPIGFLQEEPHLISCLTYYPRNCLPSLHAAWILCLIKRSWLLDPMTKILILGLAIINFIAMFGVGAHYLTDIIVGLAFANCIGGLTYVKLPWQNTVRLQAILLGGLMCLSWYMIILYGLQLMQLSVILAWCVFSASIFLSIRIEWNLYWEYRQFKSVLMGSGP